MYGSESIVIQRDVEVVMIPDGARETLPKGDIVTLTQDQGGNFTVATERGYLVRVAGADADALGKEPVMISDVVSGTDSEAVESNVWAFLKTVYDPEIPVNIVELGLVYECTVTPVTDNQNDTDVDIDIVMTLTAPGCGMGPILQGDVEAGVKSLPGVRNVNVEVVFDPPWSRDMMSESALVQLGMI